ncbi:MAG: hypothetical protein RL417_1211 [Pseudomonadota bacterium]|jgi:glycosyltransferase involved in cell wall biosynthesis
MQNTRPQLLTSPSYIPPEKREEPVVASTHNFQDSFPALGTNNAIGGSATVHAQQCLALGKQAVMVAPTRAGQDFFDTLKIPAVGFAFRGQSFSNHDEWFERPNLHHLAQVLEDVTRKDDPIYSHMPISGAAGREVQRSRGNPHIYLGHAWEILSAQHFEERGLKTIRLLAEYEMLRSADVIVTNTETERKLIARLYSTLPTEGMAREALGKLLTSESGHFVNQLILRDSGSPLREAEILAKCVANPLGIDLNIFNPERRAALRLEHRASFLASHNLPDDAVLVGSVGRIHPQKNPIAAIEVFHQAYNRLGNPDNLYLVLAGPYATDERGYPAGYYDVVRKTLENNHHEIRNRVIFPGSVDAAEMNSKLDIRIDTARFETWGLSLQEALACGLPSVIRHNEIYGELYAPFRLPMHVEVGALADELVKLVQDPYERERCSAACARAGQYYSWERSVGQLKSNVLNRFGIE